MRPFENGNTLVEYGIIGALIAAVCIGAVMFLGNNLDSTMKQVKRDFNKNVEAAERAEHTQTSGTTGSANP